MNYSFAKLCDSMRLKSEIQASAIITALDYIQTVASPVETIIFFKAALSEGDTSILNNLVSAHVNTPLPENLVQPVEIRAAPSYGAKTVTLSNGTIKKLYARNTGIDFTVTVGANELIYTASFPWVKLTGVECIGCEAGDFVDFKVYDTAAGTYSGIPNYMLNQFSFGLRLPNDFYARQSHFDADMYQGMIIEMNYTSVSAKSIGFNILMDEVK